MASFLELTQRLRVETGTAGTGPVKVTEQKGQLAQLVVWIGQAYLDILNKWVDWKFAWAESSKNILAGQSDYALASDLRQINEDAVYLSGGDLGTDSVKLQFIDYDDYRRHKAGGDGHGTPSAFTIRPDGKIRLLPEPNDSFMLDYEYWKQPVPLAENEDLPVFPDQYHDAIIWKAAMYWAGFNEAEAEFQKFNYHYETAVRMLEAAYLPSPDAYHNRAQGVDMVVETI
jgi:hypothetical protein